MKWLSTAALGFFLLFVVGIGIAVSNQDASADGRFDSGSQDIRDDDVLQ